MTPSWFWGMQQHVAQRRFRFAVGRPCLDAQAHLQTDARIKSRVEENTQGTVGETRFP